MKLFLKAIAVAAKSKNPSINTTAELHHLIDVAESSGLVLWHDNVCFLDSFWDWGVKGGLTINWGGYGSRYSPANEKYFKFQYPEDTVDSASGKLKSRRGAKSLDAVRALIMADADPDGSIRAMMEKEGATIVTVTDQELDENLIIQLLEKENCNFLLYHEKLIGNLSELLLDWLPNDKKVFFLPASRLRPLLEISTNKTRKKPVRKPKAYDNKEDAADFSKIKSLICSNDIEEVHQGLALLPGLPSAYDKLLEGVSLADGVNALTTDFSAYIEQSRHVWSWGKKHATDAIVKTVHMGDELVLTSVPRTDIFKATNIKRYALISIINNAPDECLAAKSFRDGLMALHWNDYMVPPINNFKSLKHLYLSNCETIGIPGLVSLLVSIRYDKDASWVVSFDGIERLCVDVQFRSNNDNFDYKFISKISSLKELYITKTNKIYDFNYKKLYLFLTKQLDINYNNLDENINKLTSPSAYLYTKVQIINDQYKLDEFYNWIIYRNDIPEDFPYQAGDKGDPLPRLKLSKIKKLLYEDNVDSVNQGISMLEGQSIATFDAIFGDFDLPEKIDDELDCEINLFRKFKKYSDLSKCIKINLISMAPKGCRVADVIKACVKDLDLPHEYPMPVDISGFTEVRRLSMPKIYLKDPECSHIKGLEKLIHLKDVFISLDCEKNSQIPNYLNLPLSDSVEFMKIDVYGYKVIIPHIDFIPIPKSLKKLYVSDITGIECLSRFKEYEITDLSIKCENPSLEGISSFKHLQNLQMQIGSGDCRAGQFRVSLKTFKELQNLQTIQLRGYTVDDVELLSGLPKQPSLFCSFITSI